MLGFGGDGSTFSYLVVVGDTVAVTTSERFAEEGILYPTT